MARAGKPKQATQRTREEPKTGKSPLADPADNANPADVEAFETGGSDRSLRWNGAQRAGKPENGDKASASAPAPRPRRTRSTLRPPPPKGRAPR